MLLTSDELCPNPALWDDEEMLICAEHAAAVCAPTLIAETASFLDAPPPVDY